MTARSLSDTLPKVQSLVGRTTRAAIIITLIAVASLFAVSYAIVVEGQTRGLSAAVRADLAGLADIHATNGLEELIARIDDRQRLMASDGRRSHYALRRNGRIVAGDQRGWLDLQSSLSEQGYVVIDDGVAAFAQTTLLAPRLELLVAREYSAERETLRDLAMAFAAASALITLLVFALARARIRALAQRLNAISLAYQNVDPASVEALVAEPRGDEVAEVARRSGHALAQMRRLIDEQRHISDHVAHELRTPLLHLEMRLRDLLKADAPARSAEIVALATSDIRSITTMLDSLLDIAATEARRGDMSGLATFDLTRLATDLAELYRPSMEEAQLSLMVAITPGIGMTGDSMQISRLITNLLDNAVKYVAPGGRVRFEVSHGPVIVVADDGPGIAAPLADVIFDRFRRGHDAAGKAGHGLGLALARAIAERHGLTLTLSTRPGDCRFVVAKGEDR